MIFLDTDAHYFMTETRSEMVDALLAHLPDEPDDETLTMLAAACLEVGEMDVIIIHR